MKSPIIKLLPWIIAALVWGCEKETPPAPKAPEVILNVRTVDLANAPVEMVRFYINGKKFGITDQDGTFKGKFAAKDGDKLSFNVEPPSGYSVPANIDQSEWTLTVQYPADGQSLQVDFLATLQRPEHDYLFMVRSEAPGTPVKVNGKLVGKTGATGDAMLRVTGTPGTPFTANAGGKTIKSTFSDEDEIYLLTATKAGPLGGAPAVAAVEPPVADAPPVAAVEPPVVADAPPVVAPPVAPATEAEPPVVAVAPPPAPIEPPPARDPDPVVEPPGGDLFADTRPAPAARVARQPRRRQPKPPVYEAPPVVDDPPVDEPYVPEPVAVQPPPAPAPSGSAEDDLLGMLEDDPVPAAADPIPAADPIADIAPPPAKAHSRKRPSVKLSGGIMDDDDNMASKDAIREKVAIAAPSGASPATMDRQQIKARLGEIKSDLARTKVLQKSDVDFLAQIDRTHTGYYEANRLLADFYYRNKDYRRQAKSLEIATKRGRYKHDSMVLLSLAKSYARVKNYRKSLSTMRRVERKMRNMPANNKADAYRFHAEILEFEFLRQFHDDAKRANVTLVDKSISKWERYQTFNRGADPGGVARAQKKIRELTELKSRVEL
jgi:hypothetical protein